MCNCLSTGLTSVQLRHPHQLPYHEDSRPAWKDKDNEHTYVQNSHYCLNLNHRESMSSRNYVRRKHREPKAKSRTSGGKDRNPSMLPNVPWSHVPPTGLFLTPKTLFSRATHTHKQDSQPGAACCQSLPSTNWHARFARVLCWYLMTEPITPSKEYPNFRRQERLKMITKNNRGISVYCLTSIVLQDGWVCLISSWDLDLHEHY